MEMKCKCCNRQEELRMGYCFDCTDAESVIADGINMFDQDIPKRDNESISMSKLNYILTKFNLTKK